MKAERTEQVIKPVHVTKAEAAVAVASGVLIGAGIVTAAPLVAVGGVLIGIGEGWRVGFREGYEKARQKGESKEQGEVVSK